MASSKTVVVYLTDEHGKLEGNIEVSTRQEAPGTTYSAKGTRDLVGETFNGLIDEVIENLKKLKTEN